MFRCVGLRVSVLTQAFRVSRAAGRVRGFKRREHNPDPPAVEFLWVLGRRVGGFFGTFVVLLQGA